LRASFLLSAPVEPEDRDTVLLWHQKIVDAITSGDAVTASEAMVYVIHNGMRRHEGTEIETAAAEPPPSAESGE
jgi:DNA-binding FadR family transcriptional regulator